MFCRLPGEVDDGDIGDGGGKDGGDLHGGDLHHLLVCHEEEVKKAVDYKASNKR